jgi:hypothetical protein
MTDMITPPDLKAADVPLQSLLQDVQKAEGTFAGGRSGKIGKAEAAISEYKYQLGRSS